MTDVPVLETPRLILRGMTMADFETYKMLWADPSVVARLTANKPLTEEEVWQKFTRLVGVWALKGYGYWLVEEKASGELIGNAGVAEFKRNLTPSIVGKPEFGWMIASKAQGKGYATEAAEASLAWVDGKFPGAVMTCIIDPENAPSIRVAEKCGFREAVRTEYNGRPTIIFERVSPKR